MRKILILIIVILMNGCSSVSLFEAEIDGALSTADHIVIGEHIMSIQEVFVHPLEISIHKDEVILYIIFNVEEGIDLSSGDLHILLKNGETRYAYQIDGLDYFKNPQQNMSPYIRFSIPLNTNQMILYIELYDKIFIELD